MSIDALLLHLEEDARREAARLRQEATARAEEIVARAEADAARKRALHLERVAGQRRSAGERQVAAARAEARERFLQARMAVLDRVFDAASASLTLAAEPKKELDTPSMTSYLRVEEQKPAPVARSRVGYSSGR